jgi:hypothetical protein
MRRVARIVARWATFGLASLLVQDFFHGLALDGWRPMVIVLLCISTIVVLVTAEPVAARLPGIHTGRHDGFRSVWITPPAKPLRSPEKLAAKREIALGERAINVGADALNIYAEARAAVDPLSHASPWDDPEGWARYDVGYQQQLQRIKKTIGGAWDEVVRDLHESGELPHPPSYYAISVNFTGLDSRATELQAVGRRLMRKHGKQPCD